MCSGRVVVDDCVFAQNHGVDTHHFFELRQMHLAKSRKSWQMGFPNQFSREDPPRISVLDDPQHMMGDLPIESLC